MIVRRGLIVLAVSMFAACAPAARAQRDSRAAPDRTVRVSENDFGTVIDVRVGDLLKVAMPADYAEWDVAFSSDVLRSLNTDSGRRHPPADGWTFAVVAVGTTDIAVTPRISGSGTPNVPKFVITVAAR